MSKRHWDDDDGYVWTVEEEKPEEPWDFKRVLSAARPFLVWGLIIAIVIALAIWAIAAINASMARDNLKHDRELTQFCKELDAEVDLDRRLCVKDKEIVYQEDSE